MNPAVLKMALLGSRSSWGRMAGIGGGVAIGVCLVLLLWSAANGLAQRDARGAWLREMGQTSVTVPLAADGRTANGPLEPIPLTPETILLGSLQDVFRDQLISHRDIAALPGATVKIPGIGGPAGAGQYYASPALQRLIESTPAEELGDRYGQFAGAIDDSALPGPDALVVITGATEAQLRQGPAAMLVTEFTTNPYGESASLYRTALLVGGIAVLFPVLLLGQHCDRSGRGPAPGTLCHPAPDRCFAAAGLRHGSRGDGHPEPGRCPARRRPGDRLQARRSPNTRQRHEDVPRRFHVRRGIRRRS